MVNPDRAHNACAALDILARADDKAFNTALRSDADSEITLRRNGKWAKISGQRGRWSCALGCQGDFKACRQVHYWPTKDGALTETNYWLDD